MDDTSTAARPYASALFKLARDDGQVAEWSNMLDLLVTVVRDPTMAGLIANPRVKTEELAALVIDVGGEHLSPNARNLVRLLSENRRLAAIPDIAARYEEERSQAEQRRQVEVTAAYELSEDQREGLASAMSNRLGTRVEMSVTVDPHLLGGAVIRAGDLVIDASLRGRLEQLSQSLA